MARLLMPVSETPFACSGPECRLTCCQRWIIALDAENVRWLRNHKHYASVEKLMQSLAPVPEGQKSIRQKKTMLIELQEDGTCPLLDEIGLCSLQKEAGEEALSETCRMYPRVYSNINNMYELSYHVSCSEAAWLFLSQKNGLRFEEVNVPAIHKCTNTLTVSTVKNPHPALRHIQSVRNLYYSFLQDRRYSIEIRLLYIGLWLEKLQVCTDALKIQSINEKYAQLFTRDDIHTLFNQITPSHASVLLTIASLTAMYPTVNTVEYEELFNSASEALHEKDTETITVNSYKENKEKYYDPNIDSYSYILENYLVMCSQNILIPFQIEQDVWKGYCHLISQFALIKFNLAALSALKKGLTEDDMIWMLSLFDREFMHSVEKREASANWMIENNMNTMAALSPLILA